MDREAKIEAMLSRCSSVVNLRLERARYEFTKEIKESELEIKQKEIEIEDSKIKQVDFELDRKMEFIRRITRAAELSSEETRILAPYYDLECEDGSRYNPSHLLKDFGQKEVSWDSIKGCLSSLTCCTPSSNDSLVNKLWEIADSMPTQSENERVCKGRKPFWPLGIYFPREPYKHSEGYDIEKKIEELEKILPSVITYRIVRGLFFRQIGEKEYFSLLHGRKNPLRPLEKEVKSLRKQLNSVSKRNG